VPYIKHSRFTDIEDSEQIWRVMTFEKFMSILEYQTLYFARADKLGNDLFEGHFPRHRIKGNTTTISSFRNPSDGKVNLNISKSYNQELDEHVDREYRNLAQMQAQCLFANCWYRSKHESASLWKTYSQKNGIAILSTVGRLKKSFESSENQIYIFEIKYIDYNSEAFPSDAISFSFAPFVHKRKEYESEKELRALIFFPATQENIQRFDNLNGMEVNVNLHTLIEKIYSSPGSDQWFLDLLDKIMNRYKLQKKIEKSILSEKPA
jgi:hypothetical protein